MTALNETSTLWTTRLLEGASSQEAAAEDGHDAPGPNCCWYYPICCWVAC